MRMRRIVLSSVASQAVPYFSTLSHDFLKKFCFLGATALVGHGRLGVGTSWSHSDAPYSVGLLWTSDQPDANTSTWQHTSLTTDTNSSSKIQTHSPNKKAAVDPLLRPHVFRCVWEKKLWNQKVFQFLCFFCPKQFSFKDELSEAAYVYVNVCSSSCKVVVTVVRF